MKNESLNRQIKDLADFVTMDSVRRASDVLVPAIVASFALALHKNGMTGEQIEAVLREISRIWEERQGQDPEQLVKECEQLTGIKI